MGLLIQNEQIVGGGNIDTASDVPYSNTTSGLTATNVQAAIDEIDGNVDTLGSTVSGLSSSVSSLSTNKADKTAITPTAYLTTGLEYVNCTYVKGGYFKIGSLVVFNITVSVTTGNTATKPYVKLPSSIRSSILVGLTAQDCTDDLPPIYSVFSLQHIYMKNATSGKNYVISGMWFV